MSLGARTRAVNWTFVQYWIYVRARRAPLSLSPPRRLVKGHAARASRLVTEPICYNADSLSRRRARGQLSARSARPEVGPSTDPKDCGAQSEALARRTGRAELRHAHGGALDT